MKQLYSTLALLGVIAVVGGWIYFNERGPIATQGTTVLLRAEPSSVNSVSLNRPDGKRITLSRQGDAWRVQQEGLHPVAVPADKETVKTLLDATRLVESAAIVENADAQKAKEFGLDKPQSTLVVNDAKLEFGAKPTFDTTKVYARVTSAEAGGSRVALVPATLADFPSKPFDEWRDKSVLRFAETIDVSAMELKAPTIEAAFERTEIGGENELDTWQVEKPVDARADAGAIITLLQEVKQTTTSQFLEDNPKDLKRWGLDKPAAVLSVTIKEGESTLRIGKKHGSGRAAQNSVSDAVFVVPDTLLASMNKPLRNWRDKTVVRYDKAELSTLGVQARGKTATFEVDKDGEKTPWKRTDAGAQGRDQKTAGAPATDILIGLDGLTAIDFIDKPQAPSTYGLDKPALAIELTSSEWRGTKSVQVGSKDGKVYARVGENGQFDSPIYVVAPGALESFKSGLDAIFSAPTKTTQVAP